MPFDQQPALSVVTTLFQSAATLEEFYRRMTAEAERWTPSFELILVNDGSPDDCGELALELHRRDPRVRVIDLARNFGHHKAMMTGLAHARGEHVFLIDCDLEEPPEVLAEFRRELEGSGADVVYGVQARRKGGWFERLTGWIFFRLFNLLSPYPLPLNVITVRLMTRRYVDSLVAHREREMIIAGLWVMTGYRQRPLVVDKATSGRSTYTFGHKVAALVNAVTSFSDRPLVVVFYLGCVILFLSALVASALIYRKLVYGIAVGGWASLIVSIWMLGGLTIFCLGILGIYLSKVFIETKRRPYTVIREIHETRRAAEATATERLTRAERVPR